MNTGEYAISEIDIGKVRVRIDSTVTNPYVEFNWCRGNYTNLEDIFYFKVNYMVVVCKEEDYPANINIDSL